MLVIKRFTAQWCGPCKILNPVFKELELEFPQASFEIIDVDSDQETALRYGVKSIPTIIMEKDNKIVQKFVGINPKMVYYNTIKSLI